MNRACLLLLAGLAAPPGCRVLGLSGPEPQWQEIRVSGVGVDDLWTVVTTSLNRAGFKALDLDRTSGTGTTGWDVSLFPYAGGGWRERAHVRVEAAGDRAWKVGVRVEKEMNETVKRTMDESQAEWEPEEDDAQRARVVAQRIRSGLRVTEVPAGAR